MSKGTSMLSRFFSLAIICLLGSDIFAEPIDLFEDIIIDGSRHRILIQTDNTDNPLVLYLHGGPGYSSVLESQCYAGLLRQNCIFVQWDQKGTGYSYHEDIDTSEMSIARFVEDTRMLTEYLLIRFILQCGGIMHRNINIDSIRRTSPYFSKSYEALITTGIAFSNKCFTEDKLNEIDFNAVKSVEIPLYFFLGRYDWLTPVSFAEKFLKHVKAPRKRIVWFRHSAHLMMVEEPAKFSNEIIKIIKSIAHESPTIDNCFTDKHQHVCSEKIHNN